MHGYLLLGVVCLTSYASAQQYGPLPPRPQQFAGATLIQPGRANFRQRPVTPRLVPETIASDDQVQVPQPRRAQPLRKVKAQLVQPQIVDQQRTNLIEDVPAPFPNKVVAPTPLPQFQHPTPKLTPRPVEEEVNEDEEIPTTIVTTPSTVSYTLPVRSSYPPTPAPAPAPAPVPVPALLQPNQIPSGFQRPQFVQPSAFRPAVPQQVQPVHFAGPFQGRQQLIRQQVPSPHSVAPSNEYSTKVVGTQQARPVQGVQAPASRQQIPQALPPQIPVNQIQGAEEDQYLRQVQARPVKKQEVGIARQQPARQPEVVRQPPPPRAQVDYSRPVQRDSQARAPQREKKPVVQTIRKYHEEHEDGSITWGYENDDGSFKEETIGVDCVTRGKYGYYDPDGVKREYTYQTGILCDRAQESEEAASNQGFIDYTNNKYVLPNGDEIDLEAMVKNRARKPVPRYSNRA